MELWDVFQSDRLEMRRGLSAVDVREARARGELRDDDLARPAGTSEPWTRLADVPDLIESEAAIETAPHPTPVIPPPIVPSKPRPEPVPVPEPETPTAEAFVPPSGELLRAHVVAEAEAANEPEALAGPPPARVDVDVNVNADLGRLDLNLDPDEDRVALPIADDETDPLFSPEDAYDPLEEDEAAADFSLSRGGPEKIEEIDLAPMVDVAFQLVLFFLVTATTVLFKTLEVPKPNPEKPPEASAAQGLERPKTIDELQDEFIVVAVDPQGRFTIDKEPVAAEASALVERLRKAKQDTSRTTMLLTADAHALHRYAVLAYDAANEIGLRIAIARPVTPPPAARN